MPDISSKFFAPSKNLGENLSMTTVSEVRNTLSIKTKRSARFLGASHVEKIEQELKTNAIEEALKTNAKAIVEELLQTQAATFQDQKFRSNRKMSSCLDQAKEELKNVFQYPTQVDRMFKTLCESVYQYLELNFGEHVGNFERVYTNILEPKSHLPKIPLK